MIKPKHKVCKGCGEEKPIWKTQGRDRYCKGCWIRKSLLDNPPQPKVTHRNTIRPLSDKRSKENQLYAALRKVHLQEHPTCEIKLPGCTLVATEIHHMKGRIGKLLTDKRYFKATCHGCHQWVTEHSREAIELGHSLSRLKDERMKIIFLDIDGVLNSEQTRDHFHGITGKNGFGGWFSEDEPATEWNVLWGPELVGALRRIVDATGAQIVISSTWRKMFSVQKFKEMFQVYGWTDAPVIDRTIVMRRNRGHEIDAWLDGHPEVDSYVILDDSTDMLDSQLPYFVKTDFRTGLGVADAEKAISILNKTNEQERTDPTGGTRQSNTA